MKLFRSASGLAALGLAALVILGAPAMSKASLVIQVSVDNGTLLTVDTEPSGTNAGFTGFINYSGGVYSTSSTYNNNSIFSLVAVAGSSNSPGDPTGAVLLSSDNFVQNVSGTALNNNAGVHSLQLIVGDTDFTTPMTPPIIEANSHIGGSNTTKGAGQALEALTFRSWVDSTNAQNSQSGFSTLANQIVLLNQAGASFENDAKFAINPLTTTYSITEAFNIVLDKATRTSTQDRINFSSNTTLTSVVPEPGTFALLLSGLPFTGILAWRRRKARA